MRPILAIPLFLCLFLLASGMAWADCSGPSGTAGETMYNSDYKVMQFCNGTNWISMAASGQGTETDPKVGTLTNGKWCKTDGSQVTCTEDAPVPSGAVMAFNLASCPSGWSALSGAAGRFIVGTGTLSSDTYSLDDTGGEARHTLTANEMPAHTHSIDPPNTGVSISDPGHSHTFSYQQFNSQWSGSSVTAMADIGGNAASKATSTTYTGITASVDIAPFTSGSAGGGAAHENRPPYLALLYCQKN